MTTDTSPERVADAVWSLDRLMPPPGQEWIRDELDDAQALLSALAAERDALRDEVRRFQGWVEKFNEYRLGDELSCEHLCPVMCAGPCEGLPIGAALNETGDDHGQ